MQKSYDKKCILLDIILVSEKVFFLFKSLFKIIAAEVKSTHTTVFLILTLISRCFPFFSF